MHESKLLIALYITKSKLKGRQQKPLNCQEQINTMNKEDIIIQRYYLRLCKQKLTL